MMARGRKPKPTAMRRLNGNPGKRGYNHAEPIPPGDLPTCPEHLSPRARDEWDRLIGPLHGMGVVTTIDRAALAAYCQAYGRWAEAEERLKETPLLLKTPSGYVQQSPWLSVVNRQMEIMGRYMAELGLTPASRSRVAAYDTAPNVPMVTTVEFVTVYESKDGGRHEAPRVGSKPAQPLDDATDDVTYRQQYLLNARR